MRPWRSKSFRFSTDPELEAKVRDVVGLYLDPPENASCSRGREVPDPGPGPHRAGAAAAAASPERRTHDYVRHGTTTLFAALEVATGKVTAALAPAPPQEFLRFLKQVATAYPRAPAAPGDGQLRRPQAPRVRAWLAEHPRIHVHFTPTHASWMNLVEVWFSIINAKPSTAAPSPRQRPQRQNPRLHRRLERPRHPFNWTKTADQILTEMPTVRTLKRTLAVVC